MKIHEEKRNSIKDGKANSKTLAANERTNHRREKNVHAKDIREKNVRAKDIRKKNVRENSDVRNVQGENKAPEIRSIRVRDHVFGPVLKREHLAESIPNSVEEGELLHLVDRFGRTVGTALYGIQPRSVGRILSARKMAIPDVSFFTHKFSNAFSKRISFLKSPKTDVFRVFNGEGDGIGGLTVDYYDSHFLISYYNRGIYRYRELIRQAILQNADVSSIIEKKRFGDNQDGEIVFGEIRSEPLVCRENDVLCTIDLLHGGMTGMFADQREVRKAIRNRYARGKKVLNLFSYTAMFSVFAALGGAKSTTNVDLAKRSHETARANYALNGITGTHEFIANDVFAFLKEAEKFGYEYDLIILDPPSFSNSSHGVFSSEKGLGKLIDASIKVAGRNAQFVISTNNSQISLEKFRSIVSERLNIEEEFSLPADYRISRDYEESAYLKVAICTKNKSE